MTTNFRLGWRSVFAAAALALGCGKTQPETVAPIVEAPPTQPTVRNDTSLTLEEYVQLGMPPHDREWTERDIAQAQTLLSKLAEEGIAKLPRYQSTRSGKVFARITNPDNLTSFKQPGLSQEERLRAISAYTEALSRVALLYFLADPGGQTLASEHVEMFGITLRALVIIVSLTETYFQTLDPNDATYPMRQKGREEQRRGLAKTVYHVLKIQTETRAFSESDRDRLVSYTEETLPLLYPHLTDELKAQVPVLLRDMESNPKLAFAKDRVRALREKLATK